MKLLPFNDFLNESNFGGMGRLKYISDRIRYSYLKDFLNSDIPPSNIKVNRRFLLEQDDLIYIEKKDVFIYYYELWVASCWEGLYSKPEYSELDRDEAIQKTMDERMSVIADMLNLEIVEWSFVNSIQTIKFKNKSINESKSE